MTDRVCHRVWCRSAAFAGGRAAKGHTIRLDVRNDAETSDMAWSGERRRKQLAAFRSEAAVEDGGELLWHGEQSGPGEKVKGANCLRSKSGCACLNL